MKKQKIEIELINGKPDVSSEMKAACMGEFKTHSWEEYIDWTTCKEIYQATVLASVGSVGKIVDIEE